MIIVKYLVLFCLSMLFVDALAQDSISCGCINQPGSIPINLKGEVYVRLPEFTGFEFFNPNYVEGDVYLEDGEIVPKQLLKYNGRIDGLLTSPPHVGHEILLDNYFIKGFTLKLDNAKPSVKFSKIRIKEEFVSDSVKVFAQELYLGKLSLFAYRKFKYEGDVYKAIGNMTISKQEFGPSFVYYFQLPNNKTIGFTSFKKRDLYKLFPENKDLIKRIFKEKHQHRFKDEDDLITITKILSPLFQ